MPLPTDPMQTHRITRFRAAPTAAHGRRMIAGPEGKEKGEA